MIALEDVRAAVLSDKPWSRLDELVRAELAAGQRTKQIYDALAAIADEVDDTPGLTDDGSDAFGDTLDALTGMCREDQCYQDPPNTTLPTEDEVAKLPRWARVAFAARCARRGFAAFASHRPRFDDQNTLVDDSVVIAEMSAHWQADSDAVRAAFVILGKEGGQGSGPAVDALAAAGAAFGSGNIAGYAYTAALSVAVDVDRFGNIRPFIRRDFDHLAELARWRYWTDDTPVPPEVFGPLWPEGAPQGWPADPDAPKHDDLPIDVFAREKASPQMIEDDIVHLFNAINAYHIARGGGPLTIEHLRPLLAALVPVEA